MNIKTRERAMGATPIVPAALVAGACLTIFAQPAWAQDDEEPGSAAQLQFAAKQRDSITAFAMSMFVGFGAGHFYSSKWAPGAVFAGTQALGAVGLGIGIAFQGAAEEATRDVGAVLLIPGSLVFGLSRILDAASAPFSADDRNEELLIELGVTPMVGENGQFGLAAVGRF